MSHRETDCLPTPRELARLVARASEVFESPDIAHEWLHKPLHIFHGRTPMEVAGTRAGLHAVEQALGRIEHGVFS